jgi:hypothetical protein
MHLKFSRFHEFDASDLGHDQLPEWRKRDVFWSLTLLDYVNNCATGGACIPHGCVVAGHNIIC